MPQVDKIQIGTTEYDILQSNAATFTGISNDTDDISATSWTTVVALASSETNGSIFTKLSSMFKNIRYLYNKIGNIDIGEAGTSIGDAIKNLYTNKADKNHTHDTSSLETADGQPLISNVQTNATNRAASAKLVYDMNNTLTNINTSVSNMSTAYVASITISGKTVTAKNKNGGSLSTAVTQDTTYNLATSAANGLLRKLEPASTTKFLRADGTWQVNSSGTTYANMKGCTTGSAGVAGLVPAPAAGAITRYLRCDGTWQVPPNTNTTYGTNVGCYGTLSGTTLTLNTRNFRV